MAPPNQRNLSQLSQLSQGFGLKMKNQNQRKGLRQLRHLRHQCPLSHHGGGGQSPMTIPPLMCGTMTKAGSGKARARRG